MVRLMPARSASSVKVLLMASSSEANGVAACAARAASRSAGGRSASAADVGVIGLTISTSQGGFATPRVHEREVSVPSKCHRWPQSPCIGRDFGAFWECQWDDRHAHNLMVKSVLTARHDMLVLA